MKSRAWLAIAAIMLLILSACTSVDDSDGETADGGEDTDTAETDDGGEEEPADTGGEEEEPADDSDDSSDDSGDSGDDGAVAQRDYRFVVVSHGQSSDPFWTVAANGVSDAGDDMGVTVEYQAPGTFDMVEMSQIIDAAVASEPDGLVVTLPDAEALSDSVQAAVDAGIPVISMNSGSDDFADLGVLVHVGQTEFEAGLIAGERMAEEGVTNALCINQEVGNTALDDRCGGFEEGLDGTVDVIPVDLADPAGTQSTVEGALSDEIDGILALGPTGAIPTLAAVENVGSDVALATFDLGPEVLTAIDEGRMLFAIDQAQYLQGYLPIVFMTKFLDTGALPLGSVDRVVLTGPQIVDAETAASVLEASEAGLR
ncbi:sugar ABC transporter substrate-binding protein [Euzebya tangerina]|uniref:sugar ABC transporter substrate-binding protein n=1 Tax=Euzebya tangerina TaxID=591198 RepID=UPI00196AFAD0|nr:sugar ABC transporter substrate-binding protein [Euzebya tangerina]